MTRPQTLTVLGATGSIGTSTLDIVARHPERYLVHALTGHRRIDELADLCVRHRAAVAVVPDAAAAERLRARLAAAGSLTTVEYGARALEEVAAAPEVDQVMAAIVGAAGLPATLAAARAGKRLLLANKESLVMAGRLFVEACRAGGAAVLPIDSEHNAVFQCLSPTQTVAAIGVPGVPAGVRRVLLTASGGPFRTRSLAEMRDVTPDQACAHPNWSMGRKISVDSATMMNKGLELIEAHFLFGVARDRLDVVVHPQSIIHSMVEYEDGSVLAQLGNPDMRTPIAHAMAFPLRIASGVGPLDLSRIGRLDFEAPDLVRFPCLRLAFEALSAGGSAPCVLNAANEVAVEGFLGGRIRFTQIARIDDAVLQQLGAEPAPDDLAAANDLDDRARRAAALELQRSLK
jgi:1-deoxy-D-xylulose-5-phosphate reductoisomerase